MHFLQKQSHYFFECSTYNETFKITLNNFDIKFRNDKGILKNIYRKVEKIGH